jgi:predicted RNA binding protein YcfA (HicA-like mRNA interferase family)
MARPIVVHADWDPEAAVWVATTPDLRGLVTEAESIEALRAKLPGIDPRSFGRERRFRSSGLDRDRGARQRSAACGGIAPPMADYYRDVIRLLRESGYELKRQGRGDHKIWWNPKTGIHVTVDRKLRSRFTPTEF